MLRSEEYEITQEIGRYFRHPGGQPLGSEPISQPPNCFHDCWHGFVWNQIVCWIKLKAFRIFWIENQIESNSIQFYIFANRKCVRLKETDEGLLGMFLRLIMQISSRSWAKIVATTNENGMI